MALILSIETATTNCSVSLSKNGETLLLKEDNSNNYSHAERLHVFIDETLREAVQPREIWIDDLERGRLHRRVDVEHVAQHLGIPIPLVFGVGGAMDADEALT